MVAAAIDFSAFEAGASGGGLPEEQQVQRSFDAKDWISQYRRSIPLPQLQKVLTAKSESVKTELVELINAKYSDFVALSSKMKQLEQLTHPIIEPLQENRATCDDFAAKLDELCVKARAGIQQRRSIAEKKRIIVSLQENLKSVAKTRQTLAGLTSAAADSGLYLDDFLKTYGTLEFVASKIRKVRFFVNSIPERVVAHDKELRVAVSELDAEVADFSQKALDVLRGRLRSVLQMEGGLAEPDRRGALVIATGHLSRSFLLLGVEHEFVGIFAELFVQKVLSEAQQKIQGVSVKKYFSVIEERLLTPARRTASNQMDPSQRPDGRSAPTPPPMAQVFVRACEPGVNLLSQGVGKPVLEYLLQNCPTVFIPTGILDVFAENYLAYQRFIRALEHEMAAEEKVVWRADQEALHRKWQINVYFSIREKELTYQFGEAAASSKRFFGQGEEVQRTAHQQGADCRLPATEALLTQLRRMWTRDRAIFLDGLFAKFLTLTVKLFHSWIREVPHSFLQTCASIQANTLQSGSKEWVAADLERHGPLFLADLALLKKQLDFGDAVRRRQVGAGGSSSSPSNASGSKTCSTRSGLSDILLQEIMVVAGSTTASSVNEHESAESDFFDLGGAASDLTQAQADQGDALLTLVDQVFEDTRAELTQVSDKVNDSLLKQVQGKINEILYENVKRIPSLYRMMNRPTPTSPLPYVRTLFTPLEETYRNFELCSSGSSELAQLMTNNQQHDPMYLNEHVGERRKRKSYMLIRLITTSLMHRVSHAKTVLGVDWDSAPWVQKLVHETAFVFETQATTVVEQVEASYRSLQRVKSLNASEDDQAKIFLQLKLDIAEFTKVAHSQYAVSDAKVEVKKLQQE
ncbi:unnamed protein product [Amoebophrya sp. A120]|nr:unnamed protein product [Amoebophrya sp. A120]|eukprot:GSA120T00023051001.1